MSQDVDQSKVFMATTESGAVYHFDAAGEDGFRAIHRSGEGVPFERGKILGATQTRFLGCNPPEGGAAQVGARIAIEVEGCRSPWVTTPVESIETSDFVTT